MEFLAYLVTAAAVVVAGSLWWIYGKERDERTRSRAWLGCSVLGTVSALVLSIPLASLGVMTANHTGGDPARALMLGVSPILIALLVVIVSARGRAGTLPRRGRLLGLLAVATFAIALIVLSYLILSS
jgi:cytochrome bd-type quinol oxidase subunit 2